MSTDVADWPATWAKCRPVPLRDVRISGYLGQRIDANLASLLLGMASPMNDGQDLFQVFILHGDEEHLLRLTQHATTTLGKSRCVASPCQILQDAFRLIP